MHCETARKLGNGNIPINLFLVFFFFSCFLFLLLHFCFSSSSSGLGFAASFCFLFAGDFELFCWRDDDGSCCFTVVEHGVDFGEERLERLTVTFEVSAACKEMSSELSDDELSLSSPLLSELEEDDEIMAT